MDLETLKDIMAKADNEIKELPLKERSAAMAQLQKESSNTELKLRKKMG